MWFNFLYHRFLIFKNTRNKFYLQARWNNKSRFTLSCEGIEKTKKRWNSDLQLSRHQPMKSSDPKKTGNRPGNTYDCLSLLPWKGFQGTVQKGGTQGEPGIPLEHEETGESKTAKVLALSTRENTAARERTPEIWRGSPFSIYLSID